MSPRLLALPLATALLVLGTGCDHTADSEAAKPPSPSATTTTPTAPPTATPIASPKEGSCYVLDFDDALAPTNEAKTRACSKVHTAETFSTGLVDNLVSGHLLAVDSDRVQDEVATTCPSRLGELVGGSLEDRRLSMVKAVWFTPSVTESDSGARWFRCDAIVLGGPDRLATVTGSLAKALATDEGRDRYGMCGTARPDAASFKRVLCSDPHSWRAIDVVTFSPGKYPGEKAVSERGEEPCKDAGAEVADDALDYEWAYEGPDADQWAAGQTFGRCWAPSS